MKIRLFDSLSQQKRWFQPHIENKVTMYVCGPTVYNYAHIGNARPAVVFDTLFRLLKFNFDEVLYARNITDVDDKINASAKREDVNIEIISRRYLAAYHEDLAALSVLPPTIEPFATDNIGRMIIMIKDLIEKGHAYEAEKHVLFSVDTFKDYGKLSKSQLKEMIAGARVEVAPYKKSPMDFVLWKPSSDDQPGWNSPWGRGRPGWHIECSSMAKTHLAETIDIHGGGTDLKFPHHENELAQSTCAHDGKEFARFWVHNGYLNIKDEKMSKSAGNVLLVKDLREQAPGEAIRLALLSAHYRQPLEWNDNSLPQACIVLDKLYRALEVLESDDNFYKNEGSLRKGMHGTQISDRVITALSDDLNTPLALTHLHALAAEISKSKDRAQKFLFARKMRRAGEFLGILQLEPSAWQKLREQVYSHNEQIDIDPEYLQQLLASRDDAKSSKDFVTADSLREKIRQLGYVVEDTPQGSRLKFKG